MKIIATDNFGRESVSDFQVCSEIDEHHGTLFVEFLNKRQGQNGPHFYRLVPDDHVLWVFEP